MSISETMQMEDLVEQVTDHFDSQMRKLYQEVPERFEGQTQSLWNAQCSNASMDLMTQIHTLIEQMELKLVARGEYFEEANMTSPSRHDEGVVAPDNLEELTREYSLGLGVGA